MKHWDKNRKTLKIQISLLKKPHISAESVLIITHSIPCNQGKFSNRVLYGALEEFESKGYPKTGQGQLTVLKSVKCFRGQLLSDLV